MGVFNHHISGTVSLACSEYELPSIIADIATDLTHEMWNRERHVGGPGDGRTVNKVTYKTPDYMPSSAQDYNPGERGDREHIWQATLGPDAVVFVNHPACMSEDDAHRPGFWLGNRVLPRVAQGLALVKHGPSAYRELRSYGQHNVWLCHVGRAGTDGNFAQFQQKMLAMDIEWQELATRCTTLRGGEHVLWLG